MLMHPDIDPVAFSIGPLSVHWYGIMYLLAFVTAWCLALQRAKRPDIALQPKQVEDLIVYGALGVVLGGRIGYILFYNMGAWMQDLLLIFRIWEGGMSFHGGLLGVMASTLFYCRRIGMPFYDLIDFVAVITPPGLGFGRLGNFIGQELWGRATDVSWGMMFPKDPERLVRHPSQLYQVFLEGLVLFGIVYFFSRKARPRLAIGAVFLIFYGIFRFIVEFVREPDAHIPDLIFGWMTRGQLLSIPMIIAGFSILIWAYTKGFGKTEALYEAKTTNSNLEKDIKLPENHSESLVENKSNTKKASAKKNSARKKVATKKGKKTSRKTKKI